MIGMEACGGSQYWARELTKPGHKVRLLQARFVKAFVMGNKNDVMDARAIWMAVQQPGKEIAVKQKNSSRYWFCYMIVDIYSRKIIAAEVFASESGKHAAELLQHAVWNEKCSSNNLVLRWSHAHIAVKTTWITLTVFFPE